MLGVRIPMLAGQATLSENHISKRRPKLSGPAFLPIAP